jgi:hypothetical protein
MALACRLDTLLARGFGCRGTGVIANVEAVRYTGATGTWVVDHAWHAHAYRHVKVDTQDGWWSPDPGDWPWNNEVPTSHYRSRVIELDMEGGLAPQVTALPGKVDDRFNLRETPQGLHLLTRSWAASTGHEWQLHFIPRAGDGAAAGRAEVKARALGTPQRWRYDDEALWLQTAMNRTSADGKPPRLIHQPLDGGSASTITLPFAPQRMEFLPKHLLLLAATDTHADEAARTDAYTVHRKTATPGEYVSFPGVAAEVHGRLASFNTVPWGDGSVLAGLPAAPRLQLDFGDADDHWYGGERPADLLVLRIVDGRLELGATVDFQKQQDDCTTHCVDWYGAARFFGFDNRAFGLSNNLLKELTVVDGRVRERAVLDLGGR